MFGLEIGTGVVGVADRTLLVTSLLGSCTLFPQTRTSRHGRYKGEAAHRTLVIRWETMWPEVLLSNTKIENLKLC